jgi:hypothetical protein
MIKTYFAVGAILLVAVSARSGEADRKPLDEEFLRNYMAGEYDLIECKADSSATYKVRVTLRDEGGVLQVTRFHFDGKEYDATYRWQSDPDIIHDLPVTFIFPAPNRLVSNRFSQSTNDRNEMRKVAFDFNSKFSMLNAG